MPRQARKPCSGCGLAVSQDPLYQGDGRRADRRGVTQKPGRGPVNVSSVCARHVLRDGRVPMLARVALVSGDAHAGMEQLDRLVDDARLDGFAHQSIRHAVEVAVHLDVVVEPGAATAPLRVDVGLRRQPQQGGLLQSLEQRSAACAEVAHGPAVEVSDQLPDRGVKLGQREEPPVPQTGQHPTLHDLDSDFDLGFVTRPPDAGRQDGGAVVAGHVLVGAVDPGLVAARGGHAGLEVVADDLPSDAAHAGERVHVAADPVRQRLRPAITGTVWPA